MLKIRFECIANPDQIVVIYIQTNIFPIRLLLDGGLNKKEYVFIFDALANSS